MIHGGENGGLLVATPLLVSKKKMGEQDEEESVTDDDNESNLNQMRTFGHTVDLFRDTVVNASRAKPALIIMGLKLNSWGSIDFNYWPNSKIFEETFLRPRF